jgi:adenylosuccinate synthase
MKRQIKVVIGANFGDEGKGLMTDYFASQSDKSIVVRFNGGAQAGHTVVTPEGQEHVFSNFGSASLSGVPTYLSEFFLVNPLLFRMEFTDLTTKIGKNTPPMYVDSKSLMSTPYDMLINQAVETVRGTNRHGSCGMGISETVLRSEHAKYRLTAWDIQDPSTAILDGNTQNTRESLEVILTKIRDEYVPFRLAELGLTLYDLPEVFRNAIVSDGTMHAFMADCNFYLSKATFCSSRILSNFDNIVFEGAQGLLLDQDLEEYSPHITHSSTGVKNVLAILDSSNHNDFINRNYDLEVCYVTRSYLTRHGVGPMPSEITGLPYSKVVDTTNIHNEWQGTLRFGFLNVDLLQKSIARDTADNGERDITVTIAVTCLDQIDDGVNYVFNGDVQIIPQEDLPYFLQEVLEKQGVLFAYGSWGRTRETIRKYI